MDRADMLKEIAVKVGCTRTEAEIALETVLNAVVRTVFSGGKVQLRGFGSFKLKKAIARRRRNPKTGAEVWVPARMSLHFTPASSLKRINVE